jgi:hypothetical protein
MSQKAGQFYIQDGWRDRPVVFVPKRRYRHDKLVDSHAPRQDGHIEGLRLSMQSPTAQ